MISDLRRQASESNAWHSSSGLTIEESFFLELLQKREKNRINIKITSKELQIGNLAPFTDYYSETEILRLLESLVSKQAIVKQEKGAVLLCPKCSSHTNMHVLVCPKCNSTRIGIKENLNHPKCEYWGPREEFTKGVSLRCPRCDEQLDENATEGTPRYFIISDPYFECQDCSTVVSKNNIINICVKCNQKFTNIQASYLNSVSYVLAPNVHVKPCEKPPKTLKEREEEKTRLQHDEVKKEPEKEVSESSEPRKVAKKLEKIPEPEKTIDEPEEIQLVEVIQSENETPEKERAIELPQKTEAVEPEKKLQLKIPHHNIESGHEIETEKDDDELSKDVYTKKKQPLLGMKKKVSEIFKKKSNKKPDQNKISHEPETIPEPEPELELELESEEADDAIGAPLEAEAPPVVAPLKTEPYQILMVVEDITISEFVFENLEHIKKPINVVYIDDGTLALKELRRKYDVLIIDLELKTIESKLILSEMEKWNIMTPIIALSDAKQNLDMYILNVETVMQKNKSSINNIGNILQKLL